PQRVSDSMPVGVPNLNQPLASSASQSNWLAGCILGGVGAAIGTLGWYEAVVQTHFQIGYLALVVGWLVAAGVAGGSHRRGGGAQAIAVAMTAAAMLAAQYLIEWHIQNDKLRAQGSFRDLPLITSFSRMNHMVHLRFDSSPLALAFCGLALVA